MTDDWLMMSDLGVVHRLIIDSVRVDANRAALEPQAATLYEAGWARFFAAADTHGLTPLIADGWRALGLLDRIPAEAQERLQRAYRDNAERNENVRREVREYWRLLEAADVPAIVLKGWPLAEMLYASPALRLIADMDVLAWPDRAHDGLRALEAAGLEPLPRNRDAWVRKHLPAWWRVNGRQPSYPLTNVFDPQHPRPVEIHVHLWEQGFRGLNVRDPAGVWARSRPVETAGCRMQVLSPEDTLVHLCVHWACHWIEREARLAQLVDLDRFVRRFGDRLDWHTILRIGDTARVTRWIDAALRVARIVLDTPRPPIPIDDRLCEACPPGLRRWIDQYAAADVALMDYRRPDKGVAYVLTWLSAQSLGERLGIARYALLPPREFIMGRYGLRRRWQAIPFYMPYVMSQTASTLRPFARALTRLAQPGRQA